MAAAGSGESQPLSSADRRLVDKALKRLERLHDLCSNPQLGLKNSPPYIPDLVSETTKLFMQVWEPYRGSGAAGGPLPRGHEAKYLKIHVRNLLDKTDRAVLLFKDGREKIFEETSSYRRNLTKLSLLFSHILWELKALFPDGCFLGDSYRMTKTEAGEFWRHSFGNRCIVQWNYFKAQLKSVHPFEEGMESMALKSTIDLTCNGHISVFEFDIFTRLFQPWRSLLRNWNQLAVAHPGYMAFLTYDQVTARLEHYLHRPGSYIFRQSSTRMGQWAIGHVTNDRNIIQTIPQNTPLYQALIQGFAEGCYLYPDGRDANPNLTNLVEPVQRGKVKVTEEQYELYCDISSTFQLCKICAERDKDTRIQPCGHLLCRRCLMGWQKSAGHTCPYCRCDIRGTQTILIEPYLTDSGQWKAEGEDDGEEEDHEDIELIVKELSAMRKISSLDHLASSSSCGKESSSSQSQNPETAETEQVHVGNKARKRDKQRITRYHEKESQSRQLERSGGMRNSQPQQLSRSTEFLAEATPSSSSQIDGNSGAAWLEPSSPFKQQRRQKEIEEMKAGERKETMRTMSS